MVLIGVQIAQVLTVLIAAACVLLCLLPLLARAGRPRAKRALQPIDTRPFVRRATGRSLSTDMTLLPSRDPPDFPSSRSHRRPGRIDPR